MHKRGILFLIFGMLLLLFSSYVSAVTQVQQGSNVSVSWNFHMGGFTASNAKCTMTISILDTSGNQYSSWTSQAYSSSKSGTTASGTASFSIGNSATLGTYTITAAFPDCTDDVPISSRSAVESTSGLTYFSVVQKPDQAPIGFIDGVGNGYVSGWACDNDWSGSIIVNLYIDGNVYGATADQSSESAVNTACDGTPNHRYSFLIPQQYYDGRAHSINVYGLGVDSSGNSNGNNPLLSGSPFSFTFQSTAVGLGQTCDANHICSSGLVCTNGVCAQTNINLGGYCDANNLCSSGLTCNNNLCQQLNVTKGYSCDSNRLCSTGLTCSSNICVQTGITLGNSCDYFDLCGPGLSCTSNVCQQTNVQTGGTCGTNQVCATGLTCTNNVCQQTGVSIGGTCNSNALCGPGLICNSNVCQQTGIGLGGTCNNNKLCSAGLSCNSNVCQQTNVQTGGTCGTNQVCATGLTCTNTLCAQGNQPAGQICDSTHICATGLTCSTGFCQQNNVAVNGVCDASHICSSGLVCVNGLCKKSDGASCSNANECSGNQCINLVCTRITINSASWENMNNQLISSSDSGDRVQLTVGGSNLAGQTIQYSLYKQGFLGDSNVYSTSSAQTTVNYMINNSGNYYFIASTTGASAQSGVLAVNTNISDSPPVAVISNPTANGIYLSSNAISFSQASYDVDSNITAYNWNFGDGGTSSQASDSHTYTSAGQKTITLTVTDEQGARSKVTVSILVLGTSPGIYPFIEQPSDQQAVINNNLIVSYSARQSYAVNVTTSGSTITLVICVAGSCPAYTSTSPQMQVSGSPKDYGAVLFNWTYGDAGLYSSAGYGLTSGTVGFSSTGNKNITLNLYYGNIQQSYSRSFMLFNQRQCSSDGTTWYKIDSNGNVAGTYNTMNTIACAGADLQAGTADDCCPQGFSCSTSGSSPGCVADGDGTKTCAAYTDQISCNNDSANRAQNDPMWAYLDCGQNVNGSNILCACSWNQQNSNCLLARGSRLESDPTGTISSCTFSTNSSVCANGYQTVTITASGNSNDPACVNSVQTLPCGRPVIELPFVTVMNIIGAGVIIIIIYLLVGRTGSKKGRRHRHVFK